MCNKTPKDLLYSIGICFSKFGHLAKYVYSYTVAPKNIANLKSK